MTIEWQVSTLSNGMRVVTTPIPTAQSVSVNVFVGVGSRGEERRTNGVSHFIEHMLFKGTKRRPDATMIAEAIEGAGGVLNAYTSKELTCYWNQVPFDKLDLAMDVLADMYRDSLIDQGEIDRERTVVHKRELQQPHMCIALHALPRKDPDRYPLMILNTILGRGMSSRLFKEVRERRGLAYSVGSGVARYNDVGVMSISAGVTLEHLEEATQVIRDELFKLVDAPPADDETMRARDFSTGNFRLGLESTMSLAQRAGESLLMLGEIEPIENVVDSIAAV